MNSNKYKIKSSCMNEVLTATHENWRPMRNCTWTGLRNDFLNRSAKISQTDNMQHLLTIEPKNLDVFVHFKKRGISMIKYSWIEGLINVNWK